MVMCIYRYTDAFTDLLIQNTNFIYSRKSNKLMYLQQAFTDLLIHLQIYLCICRFTHSSTCAFTDSLVQLQINSCIYKFTRSFRDFLVQLHIHGAHAFTDILTMHLQIYSRIYRYVILCNFTGAFTDLLLRLHIYGSHAFKDILMHLQIYSCITDLLLLLHINGTHTFTDILMHLQIYSSIYRFTRHASTVR